MYSWVRVLLSIACAVGAWYWLLKTTAEPESAAAQLSTPSPVRGEPPHEPDANAAHRPGGR
jgi:alpha-1,6-mannosyltransferase